MESIPVLKVPDGGILQLVTGFLDFAHCLSIPNRLQRFGSLGLFPFSGEKVRSTYSVGPLLTNLFPKRRVHFVILDNGQRSKSSNADIAYKFIYIY
jgi:hypothetical protein